jgi:hypothetical protein
MISMPKLVFIRNYSNYLRTGAWIVAFVVFLPASVPFGNPISSELDVGSCEAPNGGPTVMVSMLVRYAAGLLALLYLREEAGIVLLMVWRRRVCRPAEDMSCISI